MTDQFQNAFSDEVFFISRMDVEEFRQRGRQMVDYICEYMTTIEKRRVTPNVNPGWLKTLIPNEAPVDPEPFDDIMKDVEEKIMPGVSNVVTISTPSSVVTVEGSTCGVCGV